MPKKQNRPDLKLLKKKLKNKQRITKQKFTKAFPHAQTFLQKKGLELDNLREKSAQIVSLGALTAGVLLTPPSQSNTLQFPKEIIEKLKTKKNTSPDATSKKFLLDILQSILPSRPRSLSIDEEKYLENILEKTLGFKARASLEGNHLNTTYGFIGAEQHLRRYPGDILANHGSPEIQRGGIAPGLGAWRYFAPSNTRMTPQLEETERWYAVVQTLYLPDWNTRTAYLRDWYKYRKVLIVNTDNGNSVVARIADAGPAAWTGKHFGGSPEVMHELGGPRYKKGPVLIFFVDDPDNKIALGPIDYNQSAISTLALKTIYK